MTDQKTWIAITSNAHGAGTTAAQAIRAAMRYHKFRSDDDILINLYKVKGEYEIDGMGAVTAEEFLQSLEKEINHDRAKDIADLASRAHHKTPTASDSQEKETEVKQ